MNDRDFDNYLALLGGLLRLRSPQQSAIAQELRDHLVEHVAHLEAGGTAHDEAVRLALAEFGDAAALAANFSQLVRSRRRRLIMRLTVGSACVLAGLAIGIVALRPDVPDNSRRLVAQDTPKAGDSFDDVATVLLGGVQRAAGATASSNQQTRQRLANKIDAEFVETPLGDVCKYIGDKVGVQFYFDFAGDQVVPVEQPITFNLKSVPAEMVLDLTCRRTGLGYRLRSGVVMISAAQDLPYEPEVRVYMVPETAVEELATLIPAMVDVHSWRQPVMTAGGYYPAGSAPAAEGSGTRKPQPNEGTIQVFRGALVISQTPEAHQKIEKLLDDLKPVLDKKPTATPSPHGRPSTLRPAGALPGLNEGGLSPDPNRTLPGPPQSLRPGKSTGRASAATPSGRPGQLAPSTTDPITPAELSPSNLDNAPSEGAPAPGFNDTPPQATPESSPLLPGTDPDALPAAAPPAVEPSLGIPAGKRVPATPRR